MSKLDQIRALREAKAARQEARSKPKRPNIVTRVTISSAGRPRVHGSSAERQRAYRAQKERDDG